MRFHFNALDSCRLLALNSACFSVDYLPSDQEVWEKWSSNGKVQRRYAREEEKI
jgi:hypothetical protein